MKQKYEMMQLRRPPNRLTSTEYVDYSLHELSWEEKVTFLGFNATTAMVAAANDRRSLVLTRDKLVTYALLGAHGFPFPEVKAVAHPTRSYPGARSLPDVASMASYLEALPDFPIFAKPISGNGGFGSVRIEGYSDGQLLLHDGTRRELASFASAWRKRNGLVIQELARPHPEVAALIGTRLATARIVVLAPESGPVIHRAALRIPVGMNMIDNFQHGSSGNLLGALDVESGILLNVIGKRNGALQTVSTHPDTEKTMIGAKVAEWEAAKRLCLKAAPLFAGFRLLSFDIAFTDRGPQVIEVNGAGDFDVVQLAHGRGVADAVWWKVCREPQAPGWRRWLARSGPWADSSR